MGDAVATLAVAVICSTYASVMAMQLYARYCLGGEQLPPQLRHPVAETSDSDSHSVSEGEAVVKTPDGERYASLSANKSGETDGSAGTLHDDT